ncbi:GntR family transcriptional regulator [Variovorax sp. V213]|uniref:GntR family transcriptional regulator n=1 Tax=Variovorax sp. V213 TaxID=3065955 RepID=UPI0034E8687D
MLEVEERSAQTAGDNSPVQRITELSSSPLHEVVKRQISEAIDLGAWPPGHVLPSEISLANTMGVAVGTVRRALLDLAAEGLLSRRRKTGTVVTGRTAHRGLRYFFKYFRLHRRDGSLVHSEARVLAVVREKANSVVQEKLGLDAGADVIRLERLRLVNAQPVMLDTFILAAERVPDFPLKNEDVPQLVYTFLVERYGIKISAVREELSAELASADDARLLGIQTPAAIMMIEEVAFDQSNVPTIVGVRRALTKDHVYINEVR